MSNLRDLLVVQAGTEVASDGWGCDVAATVKLMTIDSFNIQPVERSIQVGEMRGSLAPAHATVRTIEEATATIGGLINYDDAIYWLDGAFGTAGDSDDGGYATDANGTITRTYNAPLVTFDTDLAAVSTYNLIEGEADAASNAYRIQGAVVNSFGFTFEDGAPGRFNASFLGKLAADGTLASLADRETVVAMGSHVALAIDPASDAPASTAISATAYRIELAVNCNRRLNRHVGSVYPSNYKEGKWTGTMRLVLEMTDASRAYLDSILSGSTALAKAVQVAATTGSGATARGLTINFVGKQLDSPAIHTDSDGITTVELNLTGEYGADFGNWLQVISLNAVTAKA